MRVGVTTMTTRARTTATVRAVGDGRADGYDDGDDDDDDNDVGDGDYYENDDDDDEDDNDDEARFLGHTQRRSSTIPSTSTADEPWYVTRRRERGRRRRARDDASSRRCGGAALATCAVLFVIGFSATGRSKYDDRLNMQITAYEGVVREWSSRGRDTFQGGGARTFELSATKAGASATWVSSAPVTTQVEHVYGTRGRHVSSYEPLWYELDSSDLIEAIGIPELIASGTLDARDVATLDEIAHPSQNSGDEHAYTSGYNNTAVMESLMGQRVLKIRIDGTQEIELASGVEFFTKTTVPITNWKTCKYRFSGYHHFGGCDTYSAIDKVCFKLTQSSNGSGDWAVDASYGGEGCAPRKIEDSSSGGYTWEPITRRRLVAPATGAYPSLTLVRRALMTTRTKGTSAVSLRHGSDPHVWLLNATDGTASFANDAARLNATGIAMIALACVFSIPAACLLVPLAFESRNVSGGGAFTGGPFAARATRARMAPASSAFDRRGAPQVLAPVPLRDMV
jgi:hypothetical protein